MANPLPFRPPSMIGATASFYDPSDPQQWHYAAAQQQHQQGSFEFSYPPPNTSYDELLAQFYQAQAPNQAPPPPPPPHANPQYPRYTPPPDSAYHPVNKPANERPRSVNNAPPTSAPASDASPPSSTSRSKRKRVARRPPPPADPAYSDLSGDSDDGFVSYSGSAPISVGMGGLGVRSKGARLPGACTHCKKLKMKCDFGPVLGGNAESGELDNTCRRCRAHGHVCIVEGRKPRSAPNKREYLLAQIRQKDAIIESLLKQLHNPYIATPLSIASYRMATSPSDATNRNILAWLDRLQASVRAGSVESSASTSSNPFAGASPARKPNSGGFAQSVNRHFHATPEDDDSEEEGPSNEDEDTDDNETELGESSALPDASVPLGLIANLSLSSNRGKEKRGSSVSGDASEDLDDDNVGVANAAYFMPGPATDLDKRAQLIEQHSPPEILIHGLVVPEDVDRLFEIFYTRVNPFVALLDPKLHTPASTFARCPFLFTVICAISSRYYPEKSEIYPIAMHFAKHSAANALIDGWKSVELCQAYILMSIFAVPARKWEEDRSWLYTGLAIRLATDLNLHQVPSSKAFIKGKGVEREMNEREILNRTRVWMICFNLDRSTATQFGKPSTIKEDYILRHGSDDWYKKSPYNSTFDVHMCCYTALLLLVARFHDDIFSDPTSPSGLNKHVDFHSVTLAHDAKLERFAEEWGLRLAQDSDPHDRKCQLRCKLFPFLVSYSRLVMFSFGFQQAYQRGLQPADHIFFTKCLESAQGVLRGMIDGLAPTGFMRYAPDGHFIFSAFASAFLLKLLRPEFSHLMSKEEENKVYDLIGRLIQTLSSPEIAIDDRHTPKLYARFLAGLLSKHRRDGATVGRLQQTQSTVSSGKAGYVAPTSAYSTRVPMAGAAAETSGAYMMYSEPLGGGSAYHGGTPYPNSSQFQATQPELEFQSQPVQFGMDVELGAGMADEEQMLAGMQALQNPAWWENMMMPGFVWPDSSSPGSTGNTSNGSPSPYQAPIPIYGNGHLHAGAFQEAPQFIA